MEFQDTERFTRYWTQAQPAVSSFIHSLMPDFHDAEDVTQKVAIVLLRKFGEYDPSKPFLHWAMGVARLEVLMTKRTHARSLISYQPGLSEKISDACEEMASQLEVRSHVLNDCMAQLTGRVSEILNLRYEKAMKPSEIASELNITSGSVRIILLRARMMLRDCIEQKVAALR
jgi:RNA polymerase sigma-70 factor, ECF subfamily